MFVFLSHVFSFQFVVCILFLCLLLFLSPVCVSSISPFLLLAMPFLFLPFVSLSTVLPSVSRPLSLPLLLLSMSVHSLSLFLHFLAPLTCMPSLSLSPFSVYLSAFPLSPFSSPSVSACLHDFPFLPFTSTFLSFPSICLCACSSISICLLVCFLL